MNNRDLDQNGNVNRRVADIRDSVWGTVGMLNGHEVEYIRGSMQMWAYTDGKGYAYGASSDWAKENQ
jgi:hypothetical protein